MYRYIITVSKQARGQKMNKIIKVIKQGSCYFFILQTENDNDFWYWQVDAYDVDNYDGTFEQFVNDENNGALGCSCAGFESLDDLLSDIEN